MHDYDMPRTQQAIARYESQRDKLARKIHEHTQQDHADIIQDAYDLDRQSGHALGTIEALRLMLTDVERRSTD